MVSSSITSIIIGLISLLTPLLYYYIDSSFSTSSSITPSPLLSSLWGTYRSALYMGLSAKVPDSPLVGVMYYDADKLDCLNHIRHDCDERDKVRYGWTEHDGRRYGKMEVNDTVSNVQIVYNYFKTYVNTTYGVKENVVLKISGNNINNRPRNITLLWYVRSDNDKLSTSLSDEDSTIDNIIINGESEGTGRYKIKVKNPNFKLPSIRTPKYKKLDWFYYVGANLKPSSDESIEEKIANKYKPSSVFKVKDDLVLPLLQKSFQKIIELLRGRQIFETEQDLILGLVRRGLFPTLPNTIAKDSNVLVFQHTVSLPFELDINMESDPNDPRGIVDVGIENISNDSVELSTSKARSRWNEKFVSNFGENSNESQQKLAKFVVSNMLGTLLYQYGSGFHAIDSQTTKTILDKEFPGQNLKLKLGEWSKPTSLFSTVPSSSFFPRGFLWDEGFHQLIIKRWDPKLSIEIASSWFSLMQPTGWIPREQMLSDEARNRVPNEFRLQDEKVANPPTLSLVLISLGFENPEVAKFYDLLSLHLNWFIKRGSIWVTTRTHCLGSGLDDYPRAPTFGIPIKALGGHLDLHCWITIFAIRMSAYARHLGKVDTWSDIASDYKYKLESYWNPEESMYSDYYYNKSGGVKKKMFLPTFGYVSLFPLLFGLVPLESPRVEQILHRLSDHEGLWSDYGVRSLEKRDSLYGAGENYWRGPIWININYLILAALKRYSNSIYNGELASELYLELRDNLINTVTSSFEKTGYVWEQYDGNTGEGRKSHPFTGWTALIVNIINEDYHDWWNIDI